MNRKFTTCSMLFSIALLFGCNDSSNSGGEPAANPAPNESAGTPSRAPEDNFLSGLVNKSNFIFRGKVSNIKQRLSIEGTPYTFIEYDIEEVVAGEYLGGESITVKYVGGQFDNGNTLTATHTPSVSVGQESVVMLENNPDQDCDFTNCQNGVFNIENGHAIAANGSAVTVDEKGQAFYVSKSDRLNKSHQARLEQASLENFINLVKDIDARSSSQRKSRRDPVSNTDLNLPFNAAKRLSNAGNAPKVNRGNRVAKTDTSNQTPYDKWEVEQLKQNGGNAVLAVQYQGENQ